MFVIVFLLALDVTVHDDLTVVAVDFARFEADWTDCKVRLDIFARSHLIRNQFLIVAGVRVRAQIHQELSYILGATHCREMKWCIAICVGDVRFGAMF